MKLLDKLKKYREKLTLLENRNYEFDAELLDHPIGDGDIYRLYYVDFHRIGEGYGMGPCNIGEIDYPFKPFRMPEGMSREEGFRVLSYLTDFIEKRDDIGECSLGSVSTLDSVLDLERFGFKRVNDNDDSNAIDLFTVSGRILLFKRSPMYRRYFNWYSEGVTLEEVKQIYKKIGMNFHDIVWLDRKNFDDGSKDNKVYVKN